MHLFKYFYWLIFLSFLLSLLFLVFSSLSSMSKFNAYCHSSIIYTTNFTTFFYDTSKHFDIPLTTLFFHFHRSHSMIPMIDYYKIPIFFIHWNRLHLSIFLFVSHYWILSHHLLIVHVHHHHWYNQNLHHFLFLHRSFNVKQSIKHFRLVH